MKIDNLGKVTSSKGRREPRKYFQGQLANKDLNALFKFIKRNDFNLPNSKYVSESLQDGTQMVILISAKSKPIKRFLLYGREVPSQLDTLRNIFFKMSYSLKLKSVKHKIHFTSRIGFCPKLSGKFKNSFPED